MVLGFTILELGFETLALVDVSFLQPWKIADEHNNTLAPPHDVLQDVRVADLESVVICLRVLAVGLKETKADLSHFS